jgi:hypothetical protein
MSTLQHGVAARSQRVAPPVPLLHRLLESFGSRGISFCYWKSSRRLPAVLAGEADLDLLVAREDQHRAAAALLDCGFKLFPSVPARDHPAILSYLGHDEPSGLLVHVHLHLRLVVGERLLKNYRLPWERSILARAVPHPALPARMLDPASEALLLMVRASVELRRLDPVTLRGWRAALHKFALDREELARQVDRAALRDRAAEVLSAEAADMLADAFCGGRPLSELGRLRRRIRRELAPHRLYNAAEARLRSAGRAVLWLAGGLNKRHLHLPRPWSRRAPGGGCVVALMGVDGSGKTTAVAAMRAWLGAEIDVAPIYFGTGGGRPSLLLLPLKLMVPLASRVLKRKPKGSSHGEVSSRPPGLAYGLPLMVWSTVLAVEKRRKLLAARRGAERGLVVIADRYPQDEIPGFNDGPLLPRLGWAPRWLRRFEANAYALARRLPPDLVIKLDAPPALLAQREPDMDRAVIAERVTSVQRITLSAERIVRVDATQPLAEVTRAIKREIWRLL